MVDVAAEPAPRELQSEEGRAAALVEGRAAAASEVERHSGFWALEQPALVDHHQPVVGAAVAALTAPSSRHVLRPSPLHRILSLLRIAPR